MRKQKRKQTITIPIRYSFGWRGSNTISVIKKGLEKLEKLGATHIYIDSNMEYDCPVLEISATCERKETDQEYSDRIIAENLSARRYDAEQTAREKETYERLKKKFEQ